MRICRANNDWFLVEGEDAFAITAHVRAAAPEGEGDALLRALPHLPPAATLRQGPRHRFADLALQSPVSAPTKILAAPNNFRAHSSEMASDAAANAGRMGTVHEAGFFLKANSSLVGPSEGIAQRFLDRRTDHEGEFVIVIGRTVARELAPADAWSAVAGYSLGLDITLRGAEERSLRKSIDSYTVLGPCLVTPDELPEIGAIRTWLAVNGEIRQDTLLSELVVGVAEMIAYASRFYTLYPGDLIYAGSPSGVGPIRPGDMLHAEGTGLGAMDVKVRAWVPEACAP